MVNSDNNFYKPETCIYEVFDNNIPDDNYEVISVMQNIDGTAVSLRGNFYSVEIIFGAVSCLCVCDEGVRIQSYNKIADLQAYRKNNFNGNPFYAVSNGDFKNWLAYESYGFSQNLLHFAVVTVNDFIDIAAAFPPKVCVNKI